MEYRKNNKDWAISSQAIRTIEGSTTIPLGVGSSESKWKQSKLDYDIV